MKNSDCKTNNTAFRPFRRFIALFLAVLLILPVTALLVIFTPDVYGETFLGALSPKLERLKNTEGERLIVVGGSSVAFGLDSKLLHEYTGYEVVNFGLYATLGTRIMLDLSADYIKEGDIVILAPELDSQTLSMYYNAEAVWQAAGSDLSILKGVDFDNYSETIAQIPEYLSNSLSRFFRKSGSISPEGIYRSDSFNEYGDISYPRDYNVMAANYDVNQIISLTPELYEQEFISYVNEYIEFVEKLGGTVYYTFCPINKSALSKDTSAETIAEFYRYVLENIHCPIISDPNSLIMDEGYFYDTNFHLNDAGVRVRTAKLIEDIFRVEGRTEYLSIELPPPPNKPVSDEPSSWEENEWSELFLYDDFGDGLRIIGVAEKALSLEKLEIPYAANGKNVYSIAANAFEKCDLLKEITFYENLNVIENGAFNGAEKLEKIHVRRENASNLEAAAELFEGARSGIKLYFYTETSYQNFVSGYWWSIHSGRMELVENIQ